MFRAVRWILMGFTIDYDVGILGALLIGALGIVGMMVLAIVLTAAKRAHDDIVEDEGEDPDLIA
ncbi:hypothetical protein Q4F19_04955 [Sphingomonas sp. BIUV-7]|uniref:Uncharacterized protein n=1 Tax=Sphingomonas natans TaxID=3063330 RepID=A0ABT8Y5X8_9SPHN|nr:hypothetical protein [Sphingomonas sp. BIUV-7]MDO6413725.1 hypothetical protein [Sphingomonas sp. BIUV-7]